MSCLENGDIIITILVNMHGSVIHFFDEENPPPTIFTKTRIMSYPGDFRPITNSWTPNIVYGQSMIDFNNRWKLPTTMDIIEKHRLNVMHHVPDSLCEIHERPMYDKIWAYNQGTILSRCFGWILMETLGVFLISIHQYEDGELRNIPFAYNPDKPKMNLLDKINMKQLGMILGIPKNQIDNALKKMPDVIQTYKMSEFLEIIDNITKGLGIKINILDYSCSGLSKELDPESAEAKQVMQWNELSKLKKFGNFGGRRKTRKSRKYRKTTIRRK